MVPRKRGERPGSDAGGAVERAGRVSRTARTTEATGARPLTTK